MVDLVIKFVVGFMLSRLISKYNIPVTEVVIIFIGIGYFIVF